MHNGTDQFNSPYIIKWGMAVGVSFWTNLSAPMHTLFVLMAVDYVTGGMAAVINGKWNRHDGWTGLVVKGLTITLLMVCKHMVDTAGLKFDASVGLALAFSINEFGSIVRNCADAGVKIPPIVLEVLSKAQNLTGQKLTKKKGRSTHERA
jgi:toxin secretion/phage lysis holin